MKVRSSSSKTTRGLNATGMGIEAREGSLLKMDFLGGGARKAMEKSVGLIGEEGVTMIAGSSALSSTRGSETSERGRDQSGSLSERLAAYLEELGRAYSPDVEGDDEYGALHVANVRQLGHIHLRHVLTTHDG